MPAAVPPHVKDVEAAVEEVCRAETPVDTVSLGEGERAFRVSSSSAQVFPESLNEHKDGQPNQVSTTKFTPMTWLPKSLYYQFQRAANVYFLLISVLVFFPWSPKRWTSVAPAFAMVLVWTAIKDAYEDICRHRDDERENCQKCLRYDRTTGRFTEVQWRQVLAGDLVFMACDGAFPADLLLLQAAGGNEAFISTVNLDGETNLKERRAPPIGKLLDMGGTHMRRSLTETSHGGQNERREALQVVRALEKNCLTLHMGRPEPGLADVRGRLTLGPDECSCGETSFLPRGCVLRNTVWALAVAAYVGDDTKTRLNRVQSARKVSTMQRYLNSSVRCVLLALFVICAYLATMAKIYNPQSLSWPVMAFRYLVTMYQVVPISLYVCFEMFKLILSHQVAADPRMVDPETKAGAVVRCTDLIEEMGQVSFIFSDKTGTLTANEMVFARLSVAGQDIGDFRKSSPARAGFVAARHGLLTSSSPLHRELDLFYTCLAVCHSVQVDEDPDGGEFPMNLRYSGMSPDEVALVQAACDVGMTFKGRSRRPGSSISDVFVAGPKGEVREFAVLREIEFNSDRKRMSVVVELDGEYWCVTKGADNVMAELLDTPLDAATQEHLHKFSQQGLRTLVVAMRKVSAAELQRWEAELRAAEAATDSGRCARVAEVSAKLEVSLRLVGVTAVEDRLQDGVPEAIETVKRAGVRLWVLTGDKTETSVDIARSCALFGDGTQLAFGTNAPGLEEALERLRRAKDELATSADGGLVLDGRTIKYALESDEGRTLIYELGLASRSCVCCRLSPMQKRQLVELVRERSPSTITLAIGDGANDVPMIEGAHIGIGIRGKEGAQAVQVSDIAISQFRFLVPLLLCHGARAYRRVALFLCYYLYKNITLTWSHIFWAHQGGFTGNIAYPEYLSMGYNILFTSWHILPVVCYDSGVSDEVAIANPQLYLAGPKRTLFNAKVVSTWMLYAVWHGAVAWFGPSLSFGGTDWEGTGTDFWLSSLTSFSLCVFLVNARLLMCCLDPLRRRALLSTAGTILTFLVWMFALGCAPGLQAVQPKIAGLPPKVFTYVPAAKALVGSFVLALSVDIAEKALRRYLLPTAMDLLLNEAWKKRVHAVQEKYGKGESPVADSRSVAAEEGGDKHWSVDAEQGPSPVAVNFGRPARGLESPHLAL